MRVHSTFNNTLSVHEKASQQAEKGAIVEGEKKSSSKSKAPQERPPKQRLSRGQILARLQEHKKSVIAEAQKSKENAPDKVDQKTDNTQRALSRTPWDKQLETKEKVPEVKTAEQAEQKAKSLTGESQGEGIKVIDTKEEAVGDVGKNKPDDPMTRSKLKHALSAGSFQFSEKERAALGEILGEKA